MILERKHIDLLIDVYNIKGYELQEFNNFGMLNMADLTKGIFNDLTGCFDIYKMKGEIYQSTLNPAKQSIEKGGLTGTGAPFLALIQHKNMDCIDLHGKRKIESFCNRRYNRVSDDKYAGCNFQTIKRDTNRDFSLENEIIQTGWFGMNIHSASTFKKVLRIGLYGEGCWVTLNYKDHLRHIAAAKDTDMYKNNPNVTLFHRTGFDYKELSTIYRYFYGD